MELVRYPRSWLTKPGTSTAQRPGEPFNYGTVYELSASGEETVLYNFTGGADGGDPSYSPGASPLVFDAAGNLYGTTFYGGTVPGGTTAFELTPSENGWTETVIYNFGATIGGGPEGGVIFDSAGNLYGTAAGATVFELTPSVNGWQGQTIFNNSGYAFLTGSGVTMDTRRVEPRHSDAVALLHNFHP